MTRLAQAWVVDPFTSARRIDDGVAALVITTTTGASMRRTSSRTPLAPPTSEARSAPEAPSPSALVLVTASELRAIVAEELKKLHERTPANTVVPPSEWLTADDAAGFMQLHPRTLARMADRGDLAVSKIGRHARYRRADLQAFLERRAQTGRR